MTLCLSVCVYVCLSVRLRVRLFCFLLYHLFLVPSVGLSTHLRPLLALYVRPFLLSFRFPVSLSVYLSVPLCPRLPSISRLFLSSVCFIIIFHLLIHQAEYCNKKVLWSVLIIILQTSHHTSRFRHQPPKKT